MAKRMVKTDFASADGGTFTFELWDTASVSADNDYKVHLDAEGFSVDWKGSGGSYTPIISSTLKATMFLDEEQRGVIMPAIYDEDEFRVQVKVLKDNSLWWVGIVHAEQCSEQIQDCVIAVEIGASDGLAMLENMDFKTAGGDRYSGFTSAQQVIWNCLKKIPCHSLWSELLAIGMYEWPLAKPVTAGTPTFSYTGTDFTDRGVLDYLHVAPRTFYDTAPKERIKLYGRDLVNKYKYSPDEFEPCKRVLEDILTSLGASICFANGAWHVWDYSGKIADTSSGLVNGVYYTIKSDGDLEAVAATLNREVTVENGMSEFKKGMVRRGLYAYRAAAQTHINAGSDLLYTNGIPFNISSLGWLDSNSNNTFSPYVHGPVMDFPNATGGGAFAGYFGYFDGDVQNLEIDPTSTEIRVKFGGNVTYFKNKLGDTGIVRCRVEAYNGTNWYRLSRPVRTLYYTSSSTTATPDIYQVKIDSDSARYAPKYWSGAYEWIIDTDPLYGEAWLEVPLGSDPSVVESGKTLQICQTDFPELEIYAPPCTALVGNTDNVLTTTNDNDRGYFEWRHDFTYELDGVTATVERMRITGFQHVQDNVYGHHNLLYDIDGNLLDIGTHFDAGNRYVTPEFVSDPNALGIAPAYVNIMRVNGVQFWLGDGTTEYDATYSMTPDTPKGYEIVELPTTRLGASFSHSGQARHSRYVTYTFDELTTLEDRVKFISSFDTNEENALGQMVCWQYMQARGRVREQVSGTLFQVCGRTNSSIVYPYNRLITSKFNQGVEETFSIDSCSFTLTESQQKLEMTKVTNASYITGTVAEDDEFTRGPSRPKRPSVGNLTLDRYISRKVADVETVTDVFDLTGFTGTVSVSDIDDTINKVQVTSPITDADLGGGSGSDLITILLQRF